MLGAGGPECSQHGGAGHPGVGGQRKHEPGVVIDPGQDLGIGAARERVVGEVGLPALVRQLRLEADAGDLGRLAGSGVTSWLRPLPTSWISSTIPAEISG